jgi:hypothetical protein
MTTPERRQGAPDIPAAVRDAVRRAALAAEELDAAGRLVRFSLPAGGGRVRAEICDGDGLPRPVRLSDVVRIGGAGGGLAPPYGG